MKDKVLISFGSYNSPHFLEHFVSAFERYDPGYDCDLLIWNHSSTNTLQLKLLDKYSKKYNIQNRSNLGRAQGSYQASWEYTKDYKYYFFLHDDSGFIRDNWLKFAVSRIEDNSIEKEIEGLGLDNLPVGKVGYQGYEWQNKYKYLRTGYRTIFHYMDGLADLLKIKIPEYYQHIGDDRVLYKNELLQKMDRICSIEDFRQIKDTSLFKDIVSFFDNLGLINSDPFAPNDIYGSTYHTFQTVSEFLNDIAPMRFGYRTHIIDGPGYCQEELGFNSFWGNKFISHYGDHVVFKRLSSILKIHEDEVRNRYKDKTFLNIVDNIIRREVL